MNGENFEEDILDRYSAKKIISDYMGKKPYSDEASLDKLQSNYDRCLEILDTISMPEVNLLWYMRHLPYNPVKQIYEILKNSYQMCQPFSVTRDLMSVSIFAEAAKDDEELWAAAKKVEQIRNEKIDKLHRTKSERWES